MYLLQSHFVCSLCSWVLLQKALIQVWAAGISVTLALVRGKTESSLVFKGSEWLLGIFEGFGTSHVCRLYHQRITEGTDWTWGASVCIKSRAAKMLLKRRIIAWSVEFSLCACYCLLSAFNNISRFFKIQTPMQSDFNLLVLYQVDEWKKGMQQNYILKFCIPMGVC